MPSSQLFIPLKIKVGYQERADTYTKRLAYVIYYDTKGVLRKEASWRGWIDKGKDGNTYNREKGIYEINPDLVRGPLPTHDYDNVPMEGFVLNKKAGGHSSGWNHRQTYCRVYDPRGFEFEIKIENLLFILQECTSSKGKGLEGEFVYAMDGKDLVLLPAHCEEYTNSVKFTGLKKQSVKAKDLILGASYETKLQKDFIYLGKFDWYPINQLKIPPDERRRGVYDYKSETTLSKPYFFMNGTNLEVLKDLSSLANCKEETPVSNYAELMQEFSKNKNLSRPVGIELVKLFDIDFKEEDTKFSYNTYFKQNLFREVDGKKISYRFVKEIKSEWEKVEGKASKLKYTFLGYRLIVENSVSFEKEKLILQNISNDEKYSFNGSKSFFHSKNTTKHFTKEEIMNGQFQSLLVKLEDGREMDLNDYHK